MATDPRRRQKAAMKKRRKEKERKKRANQEKYSQRTPEQNIRHAREYPIFECFVNKDWREKGHATVLLSRQQDDGDILFGVYLVDLYCLGLKNTYCNANFSTLVYEWQVKERVFGDQEMEECSPHLAHAIIYGGIDYAANLGFSPQKDFDMSRFVLDAKDSFTDLPKVEFGREGKPLYIAGPDDDVNGIMKKLKERVGEDNFTFIIPVDPDEIEVLEP